MLMTDFDLGVILHSLFSTFNKKEPAIGAPIYEALRKVIQAEYIDAAATDSIAEAMTNLDSMPSNIGKAIKNAWYDWRSKNVKYNDEQQGCWRCMHITKGYIYYWIKNYEYIGRCVCNKNRRDENLPVIDDDYLQRVGGYIPERPRLSAVELARFKESFRPLIEEEDLKERLRQRYNLASDGNNDHSKPLLFGNI